MTYEESVINFLNPKEDLEFMVMKLGRFPELFIVLKSGVKIILSGGEASDKICDELNRIEKDINDARASGEILDYYELTNDTKITIE